MRRIMDEMLFYLASKRSNLELKYGLPATYVSFGIVGAFGTILDMFSMFLFFGNFGIPYRNSRILSFIIAVTSNFHLNREITFDEYRRGPWLRQWLQYVTSNSLGIGINFMVSVGLYENIQFFQSYYLLPVIIGAICGSIFTFLASNYFVFSKMKVKSYLP